ncbi:hypothetical protein DL768_009546 [Monosporascus sp. mg162]|nr:hypothetical protein DL768_009546 [Monosporascus sp. mg162]
MLFSTPATPYTLFYTGSITNSMTAAALSLLIDNSSDYSNVTWTTPIPRLLREDFILGGEWSLNHITFEDALRRRTGYPRHDLAVTGSARKSLRNLRNQPMSAKPHARYQYCNKMYGAVGYPIETLTGSRLGDSSHSDLLQHHGGIHLAPHAVASDVEGPGSLTLSTVLDYAKYLRVMMREADPMSKAGLRELKTPRMLTALHPRSFVGYANYALG